MAESPVTHDHSLYVLIPIYPLNILLYDFHISFYILLISNSHILPLNILLRNAIAFFGHRDSAAYFVAIEAGSQYSKADYT
jgi:hypothetical protein